MELSAKEYDSRYEFTIDTVSYPGDPKPHSLMYVTSKVSYLVEQLTDVSDCMIVVSDDMDIPEKIENRNLIIRSANPEYEYARIAGRLSESMEEGRNSEKISLSPKGYYIAADAEIGENAYIEPGCFIGHGVRIGKNAKIYANASIRDAVVGDSFICHEGAIIGGPAFCYTLDDAGEKYKIPSMKRVIIGDHVEIGVNNSITKGLTRDTVLMDYVKLDAMVHIGHDNILHSNVMIAAGVTLAGYVEIGEDVFVGVGAAIRNFVTVGERSSVGMGAIVMKDVKSDTKVLGMPAKRVPVAER